MPLLVRQDKAKSDLIGKTLGVRAQAEVKVHRFGEDGKAIQG